MPTHSNTAATPATSSATSSAAGLASSSAGQFSYTRRSALTAGAAVAGAAGTALLSSPALGAGAALRGGVQAAAALPLVNPMSAQQVQQNWGICDHPDFTAGYENRAAVLDRIAGMRIACIRGMFTHDSRGDVTAARLRANNMSWVMTVYPTEHGMTTDSAGRPDPLPRGPRRRRVSRHRRAQRVEQLPLRRHPDDRSRNRRGPEDDLPDRPRRPPPGPRRGPRPLRPRAGAGPPQRQRLPRPRQRRNHAVPGRSSRAQLSHRPRRSPTSWPDVSTTCTPRSGTTIPSRSPKPGGPPAAPPGHPRTPRLTRPPSQPKRCSSWPASRFPPCGTKPLTTPRSAEGTGSACGPCTSTTDTSKWRAKPEVNSVGNLLRALFDPGPAYTPAPIRVRIVGDVASAVTGKRDRTATAWLWVAGDTPIQASVTDSQGTRTFQVTKNLTRVPLRRAS